MSEQLQVILPDEQAKLLQSFVYNLVSDSVEAAKRDAGISQRWLKKGQAAKYCGVSANTFTSWIKEDGLPAHIIHGTTLFNKRDLDAFILHNGSMTN